MNKISKRQMSEIVKDKRRAQRRKRNLIARELKMNKALLPKVVEPKKKKRKKLRVKEIEEYLAEAAEDTEDWPPDYTDHLTRQY